MKHLRNLFFLAAVLAVGVAIAQAGTMSFTTADGAAVIPDNSGGAVTACQNITVAGAGPVVDDLNVQVTVAHSWVGDLTYRLTGPNAAVLMLMNRPGRAGTGVGNSANTSVALTFDDAAASTQSAEDAGEAPVGTACASATVVGAGCGPDNYIPNTGGADTPIGGVGTNLAQYNGINPNGLWTLCVADSAGADTGTLSTWTLTVSTTPVELESFSIE